ncbi:MAG TPA: hypothetical protein VN494_02670 [Patescibacteria group bacterium]|nr:hypothetical protein [Patescibacteria group bacterium]
MAGYEGLSNIKEFGGGREIEADIVAAVQEAHKPIPPRFDERFRGDQPLTDEFQIGSPGYFQLNRFAE